MCHVLHTLNVGGAELLAKAFAEHCQDKYQVVFACLDGLGTMGAELRAAGFVVTVLDRQPGFDAHCVVKLAAFLRSHDVRLVHAHQYAAFFYSSMARMLRLKFPILFTEHGRDYPDYRRVKRVWANKILLGRSDRIVAVGNCVRSALVQYEGLPVSRVEVIYNGCDSSKVDSLRADRIGVRAELGLDKDAIGVIQVARLNRLKDHGTALRAMVQVLRDSPCVRYFIVGQGEEQTAIEGLIQELGIQQQVVMLGLRSDIPRLLEGMDLFLLSSISEGIPLTLIEAMLAKLPCVATRVGGVAEVVCDGVTGLLAEPRQPTELAARLSCLIQSPSLRREMGYAGWQRAYVDFNAKRMLNEYGFVYAKLIDECGAS